MDRTEGTGTIAATISTMKLWIDTDPGVDDAMALLMLLRAPDVEVLGLGIVGGNVGVRACSDNALKLLDVLGLDVPVHPGVAEPLLPRRAHDAGHVHGRDGFGDVGYRRSMRSCESLHAALALIEASRRCPGELDLLTLGPLSNFALALSLDPALATRLRSWVCMGGALTGHGNTEYVTSEFNLAFDPEAAAICFERGPRVVIVDWELVGRHGVPLPEFEDWLDADTAQARFYRAISRRTRDFYRRIGKDVFTPADALAATVVLAPEAIIEQTARPLAIETGGHLSRGQSVVDWQRRSGRPDNADLVLAVDLDRHRGLLRRGLGLD